MSEAKINRLSIAKHYILTIIGLAITKKLRNSHGDRVHFPSNPENYLSFCQLFEVCIHPERKVWHTFVLDNPEIVEDLLQLRKKIKAVLANNQLSASVQMEVKEMQDAEMIYLRISSANSAEKLLSAKPTFIAFVPGENYFYADHVSPSEDHCHVRIYFKGSFSRL